MTPSDKEERQEDLAATAESLHADALRIADIETEKQELDIDDPRVDRLSHEAEHLAGQIQQKSHVERDLSAQGDGDGESGGGAPPN